jgi:hypothetical protein
MSGMALAIKLATTSSSGYRLMATWAPHPTSTCTPVDTRRSSANTASSTSFVFKKTIAYAQETLP